MLTPLVLMLTVFFLSLRFVFQPRAAAKRKAVCFADKTLLFSYFIAEVYTSALSGRIFAIFVSFDRFRCDFCFHSDI